MLFDIIRRDFHAAPGLESLIELVAPSFFVDVGPRCNFRCLYCSIERGPSFNPLDQMYRTVELGGLHRLGCGFFTGGEPSLYPDLERVMSHGNAHGVPHWGITTNGWGVADKKRVTELHRLGMRLWQLSWDDFRPEVLDRLRGHRGVYQRLMEALEALGTLPECYVSLYMVVVQENFQILPDMVEFTAKLRKSYPQVKSLHISMLKPVGYALENPEVLFPMEQATPYLRRAIAQSRRLKLPIWFNHLPGCLIPDEPDYHYSSFEQQGRYETDTAQELPPSFQENRLVKPKACQKCIRFENCMGTWKAYVERFGDGAFRPTGVLLRPDPLPARYLEAAAENSGIKQNDFSEAKTALRTDAVSQQDVSQSDSSHFEVHVGFACCYHCVFCPSAAPGHHRRWARLEEVTGEIERAAGQGATYLNFSGGEPSLHPEFEQMIRRARDLGFRHIGMITNGRGLVEEEKLERLCGLGLNRVSLSFHSPNAKLEDLITGLPGSFTFKNRALTNLVRMHQVGYLQDGLSVKSVLHSQILDKLDDLVEFFVQRGVRDIGFNFIRPDHRARNKHWVPKLSDITPCLRDLVVHNESMLGANLSFLDIPLCKFPWEVLSLPLLRQRYIGVNYDRQITIFLSESDGGHKRFDWKRERKNVMKTHPQTCEQCLLNHCCEGIWRGYLDIYGSREFSVGPGIIETCLSRDQSHSTGFGTRAAPW